ncbi:ABC transporter permease [Pseudodesulfovibrio tunisiensis]|uniref:ABC transporter permease n=1 Tax=Pseudodesulfovibrio tunisiensis TaxID=463192 RepID=UPI001FB27829|nr:ABC transporter permease [Pseudodesulfovibrio tunisiensis]
MLIPLNLRIAVSSLAAHKLRAVLAMLGVFLGALAFTGVQHVSGMMVRNAEIEAEKLGPNLYAVVAGSSRFSKHGGIRFRGMVRTFTLADARALIAGVPSVIDGTPFHWGEMPVRGNGAATTAMIVATYPNYQDIRSFRPDMGRFFTEEEVRERAKVCVLGREIATRLFTHPESALGQMVYVYRAGFRVVGIMEAKGRDVSGQNQDETFFLPLSTYMRRASNQDWISGVFLRLARDATLAMVEDSARDIMRRRHNIRGDDEDFSLMSARDAIQLQQQALDLMQTLGGITSGVSFAVGGLGILSIMILVVRSRRVEIGVRRAVGGRRRDIVRQFLFESALMAGTGGALGVLITVVLVFALSSLAGLPLVLLPASLLGTLAGSFVLGVAAGAYPAWQAARIQILDVLKV